MGTKSKGRKLLGLTAVAGGVGALGYLRNRWQRQKLFGPNRYPDGDCDPAALGLEVEDRSFSAGDGVELHGWWIPRRRALGTVLYCHGSSGSITHQVEVLAALGQLRANLFAFDYRGYGRSTGEPSEAGLFRDARAAWDHLVEELAVRPEEILLFGHSLGGAVAANLASERRPAAVILESCFSSAEDMARRLYPFMPVRLITRLDYPVVNDIARLNSPLLVVHSRDDEIIPFSMGQAIFSAAPEPRAFLEIRGDHNNGFLLSRESYVAGLRDFITEFLPD